MPIARTRWIVALLFAVGFGAAHGQLKDMTANVRISQTAATPNPITGTVDSTFTVTNTSSVTLRGPLWLALESASPANVALYNSYGRAPNGAEYIELPLATGTLAPARSVSVNVQLLTYGQSVRSTTFSLQGRVLSPSESATLVITTGHWDEATQRVSSRSVGAGWEVLVDGVQRGFTKPNGGITITVETDAEIVSVQHPNLGFGSAILPRLKPGSTTAVNVVIDGDKIRGASSLLRIQESKLGILARNVPAVTLRFFENERPVRLRALDSAILQSADHSTDVSELFTVMADGAASAIGASFMAIMAGKKGPQDIEVFAEDVDGRFHSATARFELADHRIRIQLVAPPSNPSLSLGGVRVTMSQLDGDARFVAESDANGTVIFPDVPAGNLDFRGSTRDGSVGYTVFGTVSIRGDSLVRLVLMSSADILAGVIPLTIEPLSSSPTSRRSDGTGTTEPTGSRSRGA
jgi:hypothetical protein